MMHPYHMIAATILWPSISILLTTANFLLRIASRTWTKMRQCKVGEVFGLQLRLPKLVSSALAGNFLFAAFNVSEIYVLLVCCFLWLILWVYLYIFISTFHDFQVCLYCPQILLPGFCRGRLHALLLEILYLLFRTFLRYEKDIRDCQIFYGKSLVMLAVTCKWFRPLCLTCFSLDVFSSFLIPTAPSSSSLVSCLHLACLLCVLLFSSS